MLQPLSNSARSLPTDTYGFSCTGNTGIYDVNINLTGAPVHMDERSTRATRSISKAAGSLGSFPVILLAMGLVAGWIIYGFFVEGGFRNNLFQLLLTAGTNIIIFLMVFIIQNTQNREDRAVQTKLDAQAHALRVIIDHLNIKHESPLAELAGLEEAPEEDIKREQEMVRKDNPARTPAASEAGEAANLDAPS